MIRPKLAIKGGSPVRSKKFSTRTTIGAEEKSAVLNVLETGSISEFFGSPGPHFLGGPRVRQFEKAWAEAYGYAHSISVNSWTTGLMTAVGAAGISPGDEVICTPYSMSATASAILFYGGIPVFVDIETETFNINPAKIEAAVTPRTKAIMLVHLFGHPAEMDEILKIAKKHNLMVIEDAAHAPGVRYKGKFVGAIGDIGGFSFNYHKHIHTGEGGMIVTQNAALAQKCQLIRNHGENCIEAFELTDLTNVVGANYRLTELQAAVGLVQMQRLQECIAHRNRLATFFSAQIKDLDGLTAPVIKEGCEHAFYVYAMKFDEKKVGITRSKFVQAVLAELPVHESWEQIPLVEAYTRPLYLNPIYQKQVAIGSKGFPFSMNPDVKYNYSKGLCPAVERMFDKELFHCPLVREAIDETDISDVTSAIKKVYENRDQLRD